MAARRTSNFATLRGEERSELMPLFDHFRPPVEYDLPWDSLHSGWASTIVVVLNQRWLTRDFIALEHTHVGPYVEIDVGRFERPGVATSATMPNGGGVATLPEVYAPPGDDRDSRGLS
jgi:hypothetical protein